MDLQPFKLDIDELINEFTGCGSLTLSEFKRVWLSKKFTLIFEASPSTNQGFFMQSLYAHCLGYVISAGSFANRFGGLYCLYCLYETQPFKPPYKIYLSLGELRQIKNLAIDAKTLGVKVVSALLKSMLESNMFLFGFVGVSEGSATERVNKLTDIQNARIQAAYKKLFADSRLEHFIHMDMGTEMDIDSLKKKSSDYAVAKQLAVKEASHVIDVQNVKHIAEDKGLIGDIMEKTATDWNSQKELFYEQTGFGRLPAHQDENSHNEQQNSNESMKWKEPCDDMERQEGNEDTEVPDDPDNFCEELEEVLLFEPFECADEEAEPPNSLEEDTRF